MLYLESAMILIEVPKHQKLSNFILAEPKLPLSVISLKFLKET